MRRLPDVALSGAGEAIESMSDTVEKLQATIKQLATDD
jgi:hypothetical protein